MTDQSYHVYVIQGRGQRDYADCQAALTAVPARMTALPFIATEDEMIARTRDADALVTSASPVTRSVMSALEGLKVVARTGVGYDVIDVPAATELGVIVVNIPDIWVREVANHALALLLAWNRKIVVARPAGARGRVERRRARRAHGLAARRDGRHRGAGQHRQRLRAARGRARDEGHRLRSLRGRPALRRARRGARDARGAGRAGRLRLGPHAARTPRRAT